MKFFKIQEKPRDKERGVPWSSRKNQKKNEERDIYLERGGRGKREREREREREKETEDWKSTSTDACTLGCTGLQFRHWLAPRRRMALPCVRARRPLVRSLARVLSRVSQPQNARHERSYTHTHTQASRRLHTHTRNTGLATQAGARPVTACWPTSGGARAHAPAPPSPSWHFK